MRYPIVIHSDPDGGHRATVPDLPGCHSAGGTVEEAIESARSAIASHLEALLLDADPIPRRSPIEAHRAVAAHRDGLWAIVDVDVSKLPGKARRLNITLPARVAAIVDRATVREGVSRSGFLARAALSYIRAGAAVEDERAPERREGTPDADIVKSAVDGYGARIAYLRHEAAQDGYELDCDSERDFWRFVGSNPTIRQGDLVLLDNGNLRAIWRDGQGQRMGLQFLGGEMVQFVIFARRTATRR